MLSRRQSSLKLITFEGEPRVLWNGSHPVGRGVHPYHDIHKTRLLTHLSSSIDRNFWKYFQSQPGPAGQIKSELWQVRPHYILGPILIGLCLCLPPPWCCAATSDALAWSHHPSAAGQVLPTLLCWWVMMIVMTRLSLPIDCFLLVEMLIGWSDEWWLKRI